MTNQPASAHTVHVPVMGTGFTIDTPLRIAKYGISSVVSLVDDLLVEQMRKFHCEKENEPYDPIGKHDEDARARRFTAYLNLLDLLVKRQVTALQTAPFEPGSEIVRYFELLPESGTRRAYEEMLRTTDPAERTRLQDELRPLAVPGRIDVNIMTKLDRDMYRGAEKLAPEQADAMSALRGFALSDVQSAIIFSAGMNQRLYSYAAEFDGFFLDETGSFKKRIILKVSDFRSVAIQGKFLAKRGLWVSEYRLESGLNCGGHAFPTKGYLMGPILAEFQEKKHDLIESLRKVCNRALEARGRPPLEEAPPVRYTAQGGISSAKDDRLLRERFQVEGTGWATPFLLVPEVTNVDDDMRRKLIAADEDEVFLSNNSPLRIPYWNLRSSAAEDARRKRIFEDRPGSACPKGHLVSNTEFTDAPICVASRGYVKRKLKALDEEELTQERLSMAREVVLARSCICNDLAGSATRKHGIDPTATPAVCCGPTIARITGTATLEQMLDHIYGRQPLATVKPGPHVFIRELEIYMDYLASETDLLALGTASQTEQFLTDFKANLLIGIEFYRALAAELDDEQREAFLAALELQASAIEEPAPA